MKILYITPKINNEGGVAKVLSVKTNYLIEKLNYEISIITQNHGNTPLFFDFNAGIKLFDLKLITNNKISFLSNYKKQVEKIIVQIKPDCIVVCDNGLKGFLFPYLIKTKIPLVFEIHGSKFNEEDYFKKNTISTFLHNFKYKIRNLGALKFDYLVALSKESAAEWSRKNTIIIPNAIEIIPTTSSNLQSQKVLFVGRHSHEKGIDRLLNIWKIVAAQHPNWMLEIYGKSDQEKRYQTICKELDLEESVQFFEPTKELHNKYLDATVFVMTSRQEGFPMVLLEAMSFGLPIVAFDCPIGPKSILTNNKDAFLIEDGDTNLFAKQLTLLMDDCSLRKKMGQSGKQQVTKYNLDAVMVKWQQFFESI